MKFPYTIVDKDDQLCVKVSGSLFLMNAMGIFKDINSIRRKEHRVIYIDLRSVTTIGFNGFKFFTESYKHLQSDEVQLKIIIKPGHPIMGMFQDERDEHAILQSEYFDQC